MKTKLVNLAEQITININTPVMPNEAMQSFIIRDIEKAIGQCTVNFLNERGYEFSLMAFDGNRSERDEIRAKAMTAYFTLLFQNR